MNEVQKTMLQCLGAPASGQVQGSSWGVPWKQGTVSKDAQFILTGTDGTVYPSDAWPLAYWPDGSLKWSAHASGAELGDNSSLMLAAVPADQDRTEAPRGKIRIQDKAETLVIHSGAAEYVLNKGGSSLIESASIDGTVLFTNMVLNAIHKSTDDSLDSAAAQRTACYSYIKNMSLEQAGSSRAVVRYDGIHISEDSSISWLPFCLRLYFYSGAESVRIVHSFEYDADEYKDFVAGLGVSFSVPLRDELQDRHIRFAGEDGGLFAESVKGLTGLRRFPGEACVQAQINGKKTPEPDSLPDTVSRRLHLIPSFGDYSLCQQSCDSFCIKKRTAAPYGWVAADRGGRAEGLGYVGGVSGGAVFGIRDFWKSYPSQLDIRHAASDTAVVSLWLWSPDAPPMDLRFYHDGLGQDSYEEQLEGLEITYEDYEPGFGRPEGIARTSELFIRPVSSTPSREGLVSMAKLLNNPVLPVCKPEYYMETEVFGALFGLPDRGSPEKAAIEQDLDWYFDFYAGEIERRRWYGFWDYGDVMHSYDPYRHVWKYDVGGYAWDNSELSTDLWLWYYFLRSGRADVFRVAEAMTRHTGEVDVHHSGRFAPLGSRHNVRHWGCSAKQLRISTAANRRFYYYLTTDERVGALLRAQVEGCRALERIQAGRKIIPLMRTKPPEKKPGTAFVDFGTDWGAIAAAWLTEWERTGSAAVLERLKNSMQSIADQPRGFFSGASLLNLDSGVFERVPDDHIRVSHLSSVFGLFEICAELVQLIDMPEFKKVWLDYCRLYNERPEVQQRELGEVLQGISLRQGHSRLSAYAAAQLKDPQLARLAWEKFSLDEFDAGDMTRTRTLYGPDVLRETVEAEKLSTNHAAQWCLAAMQCLKLLDSGPLAELS